MSPSNNSFPFDLGDIKAWIIKRKDGTIVRYNVIGAEELARQNMGRNASKPSSSAPIWSLGRSTSSKVHYSHWCKHEPHPQTDQPIFEKDGIRLFIADSMGARAVYQQFDVAVDGGGVLSVPGEYDLPILYGDPSLRESLSSHVKMAPKYETSAGSTKILKIRWFDREAPPLNPSFWPALLSQLKSLAKKKGEPINVLTICVGGHGRSGTALASLIMCLTDYTPLDVLTHVRALHCARAIESKEQHVYLNSLADHLGRDADALDAEDVKSFKDRFLTMESSYAAPYMDRVREGKGATVSERSASFL